MAKKQASLPIENAESDGIGTSSGHVNLHEEALIRTSSHSRAEAEASNADLNQTRDSILFPEIEPYSEREETQKDKSSQCTLMCKELLEAAINGRDNTLTQLLGLEVGQSPDSAHVTIEASDNVLNQAENLQSRTPTGNTVLHILASNGHSELAVKTYIKDKSLLEVCNNTGETALHCTARYGHSNVISELIDKAQALEHDLKDTLRKKNRRRETALHEAARHGHTDTVQTLITEDPELAGLVNKNDESPLYLATVGGHVAVVGLIVQHLCQREITSAYYSGPKRRTALHAAVLRRKKDMVDELLKLKSATFAKEGDIFGSTPLHYAAAVSTIYYSVGIFGTAPPPVTSTEGLRIVEKLLEHDAFLAYCDDSLGLFPLHVAAYIGRWRIIVNLLENNLDSWELLDHRGRNFLHVAAESSKIIILDLIKEADKQRRDGHPKLWEVLRKASSARDSEGNTPLDVAAHCGHTDAVDALVLNKLIDISLTSLDNLALSYKISKSTTDEKYKAIYQHYKSLGKLAGRYPYDWLRSYSEHRNSPERSDTLATKVQTIALGSVLIATVTFAAAFTPPGGFNSSDGTPALGRKSAFKAFILADFAAFASSFGCTFYLILLGANTSGRFLQKMLYWVQLLFLVASTFTGLAFVLGLYVVLGPVSKVFSIFVLVAIVLLLPYGYPVAPRQVWWVLKIKKLLKT